MKKCHLNVTVEADEEGFIEAMELLMHTMDQLDTHEQKVESENLDLTSPYYTIKGFIQYDGRTPEQMKDDARENALEEKADDKRKYPDGQ